MSLRHCARLLLATAVLSGCGDEVLPSASPVSGGSPYAGSLVSPSVDPSARQLVERAGVAGLALECDGEPGGAEVGPSWVEPEQSPEQTLDALLTEGPMLDWWLPVTGWRQERVEPAHVLFSFDAADRSKATVVVARGSQGWAVDAAAWCDRSEYAAETDDPAGVQVWEDTAGRRVPTTSVQSSRGPKHCGWEEMTFLHLGRRQFLRDPSHEFADRPAMSTLTTVPPTARDTGWRRAGRELWLDDEAAYVVGPDVTERWPEMVPRIGCA